MTLTVKNSETYLAILLAALPVLVIGASYGWGANHSTYLMAGLKMAHPDIWQRDWWVNETTHYHVLFSYLVYVLEKLGILKPAITMANVLVITGSFFLIYKIIKEIAPKKALEIFAGTVLLFGVVHETKSVALTFFFFDSFQPSSFGVLGYLLGMYFFIRRRYLFSGLSVGLLSLFHANFLILAFPLFGLAHLLVREEGLLKRSINQFTPLVVAFLVLLPSILGTVDLTAGKEITARALKIIFIIRSPWHYDFSFFKIQLIPLIGWLLLGVAAVHFGIQKKPVYGRFSALFWALILCIGGATIEAIFIGSDVINRLFIWRLAPFAFLYAIILLIATVFENSWPEKPKVNVNRAVFALFILAGLTVMLSETSQVLVSPEDHPFVFAVMPLVLLAFWGVNFFRLYVKKTQAPPAKSFQLARSFMTLGLPAALILIQGPAFYDRCRFSYLDESCFFREKNLYRAVQTLTAEDALFMTPPSGLVTFRLFTQRSQVASWNEVPFTPHETLEWYKRASDLAGGRSITEWSKAYIAYQTQSPENLVSLREKYGVDYAVFGNNRTLNLSLLEVFGPPVYKNESFYLFSLKPEKKSGE